MRLLALHVRSARAPLVSLGIPLQKGYTLVAGPQPSLAAVRDVLLALLCPRRALETFVAHGDPSGGKTGRAVLTFRVGADTYRIAADLGRGRLALARHEPPGERFLRVASGPEEVERRLTELGRPDQEVLERLCVLAVPTLAPEPRPVAAPVEPAPPVASVFEAPPELERPGGSADEESREGLAATVEGLAATVAELELEEKRLAEEVQRYAPLLELGEDVDSLLERYRAAREESGRGLASIDRMRRDLLEEHGRLMGLPSAQRPWIWLGSGLAATGGLAGYFFDPFVGLLGVIGIGTVYVALSTGARARRRLGQLEARLAALRVREGTIERRLDEEAPRVRELMEGLGLKETEELGATWARARELSTRLEEMRSSLERARLELAEARGADPEAGDADAEADPDADAMPEETDDTIVDLPIRVEADARALGGPEGPPEEPLSVDLLVDAVARWTRRSPEELWAEIRTSLPLYLPALTGGRQGHPEAEGSELTRPGGLRDLPERERQHAEAAFQLALFERLASLYKLPLLVGPLVRPQREAVRGLARALARLASVAQVLQLSPEAEPWCEFSDRLYRID
jgi:hypothetical protein